MDAAEREALFTGDAVRTVHSPGPRVRRIAVHARRRASHRAHRVCVGHCGRSSPDAWSIRSRARNGADHRGAGVGSAQERRQRASAERRAGEVHRGDRIARRYQRALGRRVRAGRSPGRRRKPVRRPRSGSRPRPSRPSAPRCPRPKWSTTREPIPPRRQPGQGLGDRHRGRERAHQRGARHAQPELSGNRTIW